MFIIESYSTAVVLCFVTMLCWGSWPNTHKLAGKNWPFELFYWDYVLGILFFTFLLSVTLGSMGNEGRSFFQDIGQASYLNILSAIAGGIIFNIANILLTAAMAIAGMSVAFPVGIGLALIIGVVSNYQQQPTGDPAVLSIGVLLIASAIVSNALAYRLQAKASSTPPLKGLVLAIISGCLMGLFYKYVADSMVTDFANPEPSRLTPYSALFIFSLGVFLSNIVLNPLLIFRPITRKTVDVKEYFRASGWTHLAGILGGSIWALGMSLSILSAEKAGPAISYGLGQGATLVAAIWGIFIWKEFDLSRKPITVMLQAMLLLYLAGLVVIIISR